MISIIKKKINKSSFYILNFFLSAQCILSWVTEYKLTGTLVSNQGKQRFTIARHNVHTKPETLQVGYPWLHYWDHPSFGGLKFRGLDPLKYFSRAFIFIFFFIFLLSREAWVWVISNLSGCCCLMICIRSNSSIPTVILCSQDQHDTHIYNNNPIPFLHPRWLPFI